MVLVNNESTGAADKTGSLPDRQPKIPTKGKEKLLRIVIWVVATLLLLLLIPGLVAVAWVPSCSLCHKDLAESRAQSSVATHAHNALACTSCHGRNDDGSGAVAFREKVMYQMIIPLVPPIPAQLATVSSRNCQRCHSDAFQETTTSNGIIISHENCATNHDCIECHATAAHELERVWAATYDMNTCVACHKESEVSSAEQCNQCHAGNYERPTQVTNSLFGSTHGPEWKQTHGMGDKDTCASCHQQSFCQPCHGAGVPHQKNFMQMHGTVAVKTDNKCGTCHDNTDFCDNCHGITMPHPTGFMKNSHAKLAAADDAVCYNCHLKSDCENCHKAHTHPGGAAK
ncbi:MAG: hypothetical protein LBS17_02025 [Actinomycetes bacterium]|jgi:hypothetical protein|nr:hypothetical protein [Actinomycetes bacterium]